MPSARMFATTCLGLLVAYGGRQAAALRTKVGWQMPVTGGPVDVHRDLHMSVIGLMPFTRLRVDGPLAVNVVTRTSAQQPYLIRQPEATFVTWVVRGNTSEDESELALQFPGPPGVPVVATIVVPRPLAAVRATYQANVTVDYSGADIAADTFGQISVQKAFLPKSTATPTIEVTSQSNITIGELYVEPGAAQVHFSAVSHGIVRVFNYVAPQADNAIRLEAKDMGIVIIDGLWAPLCKELRVSSAEQGHIVTRRGTTGRAEVYSGTGSVASLGHTVTADSHVYAGAGSFVSLASRGFKAYAECSSGSLIRVAGARQLERTMSMGCHIYQPGEQAYGTGYCPPMGRYTAACAMMPLPPPRQGDGRLEGLQAPVGALQWLETGGLSDPDSQEGEVALNMLVFKNAEWYTQVHNVIHRFDWRWEQDVLRQQLAISELVSGAPR